MSAAEARIIDELQRHAELLILLIFWLGLFTCLTGFLAVLLEATYSRVNRESEHCREVELARRLESVRDV